MSDINELVTTDLDTTLVCHTCSDVFTSIRDFGRHKCDLKHNSHVCQHCSQYFMSSSEKERHTCICQKGNGICVCQGRINEVHKCNNCDKNFISAGALYIHAKMHMSPPKINVGAFFFQ